MAKKRLRPGVSSKDHNQVLTAKEFISGSIKRAVISAFITVSLVGFFAGCIVGGKEYGWDIIGVVGAGIVCAIFITIDVFTGVSLWLAFNKSDVDQLEKALPYAYTYIYIAAPILYLILMLRWRPAYLLLTLFWQQRGSGHKGP